jgi:acyl carrier protein
MSETRQAVMKILRSLCSSEELRARLTEDTELMEAGVLDSFGVVRLIQFMEEEFGISIPESDIGPALFASPGAISSYIEQKRSTARADVPGAPTGA